jgi:threonine dehydratase
MNRIKSAMVGVIGVGAIAAGVAAAPKKVDPLPTEITTKDQRRAKKMDARLAEIQQEIDDFNDDLADRYKLVDGCDAIDWNTRKIARKPKCSPPKK